ncbi:MULTISPECIES: cytochrome-c oxidase, cbb3-type subunit III [Hydrocarboniphaga]|jgi:cytochrome c oxidase cbb3-type subunit 3|uniref:Cbb3-type cytochrome c oxidase subunit n=1 Tax=Hydrocarboniphaga effusa AP103 TaxID=1172194 RepID=I8I476_9GAMM|nr:MULTISPECIES: cytochrome-c oxidase, cbb3-type subunit III [Hydrocarboniphaga]EIT70956.1 hypothetical protein WQQ_10930 [Hydrocarboniphaga effusa AP103]MDZ4079024.1 cytochrome-c oxidase, cbb3-type subunit III [Hydrocarboniphaga sp.]
MSQTWHLIVVALVLFNIAACIALLIWTSRRRADEPAEGAETGHVWDGDLREYNNPLPRWWLNLFVLSVIFSIGYLVLYPGLGNLPGRLGWTSSAQADSALAEVEARRAAIFATFKDRSVESLQADAGAVQQGAKLFESNCAGCHGTDARGAKGFPNLRDRDWLYGGSAEQVLASITNGRNGQMPSFYSSLEEGEVRSLVAFVRGWHRGGIDSVEEAAGRRKFGITCAACHGADGKGNTMLGAPNLSDNTWLHGSSEDDVKQTILFGRNSQMPAFGGTLDETQRRLLAAYVLSLSQSRQESDPQ